MDDTNTTPESDVTIEPTTAHTPPQKLGEEFREFGSQLMRAIRAVADSEELRNLGNEIIESLRDIGEEVQETFERTRDKEEVKAVGEQARRMTQAIASTEGAGDVQQNLSQALRSLNNELNKFIDEVQTRSARASQPVEGTARSPEGKREMEQFSEAMNETLEKAEAESPVATGMVHDEPDNLEEAWHEDSQEQADNTSKE